jgi:hypothetical protein
MPTAAQPVSREVFPTREHGAEQMSLAVQFSEYGSSEVVEQKIGEVHGGGVAYRAGR